MAARRLEPDKRKGLEVVLYVARRLHDRHAVLKALYLADQLHLVRYGRQIYEDSYIAMTYGSVASAAYDMIKIAAGENQPKRESEARIKDVLVADGTTVRAKRPPDGKFLSETDIECLDEAVGIIEPMDFNQRSEITHGTAWRKANGGWMSVEDIVREVPDTEEIIEYLSGR